MKIVIDARWSGEGSGVGRYLNRLLAHLQELDTTNNYVVLLQTSNFNQWQASNPNFTKSRADFKPFSLKEQLYLPKLLRNLKPDVVHFPYPNVPLLYRGTKITTIHDLTTIDFKNIRAGGLHWLRYNLKYWALRYLMWRNVKTSSLIITPTKFVREQIIRRYRAKPDNVVAIPMAADKLAVLPNQIDQLQNKQFFLYTGAAYPYKNLERLIAAFKILQAQQSNVHLVLAGKPDWFWQNLEQATKARAIPNIHWLGFVSDEQLVWLYRNALGFVYPSLSEGFGLQALEAMHFDLPVLSSDRTSLPEVCGHAALYFNPANEHEIATQMRRLMEDEALRQQLIKAGQKQLQKFSWADTVRQTLELYRQAGGQ